LKKKPSRNSLYIDSNIFIYPAIYDSNAIQEAAKSKAKLLEIASGSIEGYTSTLTWDEVTWVVRRLFGVKQASAQGASFLKFPNLTLLRADSEVLSQAQSIIEEFDVKPRDAIHAASAMLNGIDKILSYDKDFDAIPTLSRIVP
jgi:hypothetical protein